jgi:hypothetical protein
VDGASARGEFCSPDCRAKDPEKYAPGWDDSKGGSVENADDLIKQALGLS